MPAIPQSEVLTKLVQEIGETCGEVLARFFLQIFVLQISRENGCKKSHKKSSTSSTLHQIKFLHCCNWELGGPNKTRRSKTRVFREENARVQKRISLDQCNQVLCVQKSRRFACALLSPVTMPRMTHLACVIQQWPHLIIPQKGVDSHVAAIWFINSPIQPFLCLEKNRQANAKSGQHRV